MKLSRYFAIIALAAAFASCASSKGEKFVYFQDIDTGIAPLDTARLEQTIKIGDELIITVNSLDPEATAVYNTPLINPAHNGSLLGTGTQPRLQTYMVDRQGNIQFPMLGDINVLGLTLEQLRHILEDKIGEDVDSPIVKVAFDSYRINVAGEVKNPRTVYTNVPKYTVLDAITVCGDLTPYGRRDNVLVVREESDGTRSSARLDLTKAETFSSPYYYLQQNDYVYVEPTEVREDNAEYNQTNAFKLSVISTIVSAVSVVASLVIALTR